MQITPPPYIRPPYLIWAYLWEIYWKLWDFRKTVEISCKLPINMQILYKVRGGANEWTKFFYMVHRDLSKHGWGWGWGRGSEGGLRRKVVWHLIKKGRLFSMWNFSEKNRIKMEKELGWEEGGESLVSPQPNPPISIVTFTGFCIKLHFQPYLQLSTEKKQYNICFHGYHCVCGRFCKQATSGID